jgi:decaprenylphospho-beta-D-erythro-pentofuranosid-2-ulose 2-reductase
LGGGSDIAVAFVQRCLRAGLERVVLAGRAGGSLTDAEAALSVAHPGVQLDRAAFDGSATESHGPALRAIDEQYGPFDTVLVAFGALGDPFTLDLEPDAAAQLAHLNYVGAVSSTLASLDILRGEPNARLIVMSSIAAVRPRVGNLVYGSAKAGLDAFARELRAPARKLGVDVIVVRPGFVHTRMTEGLEPAPLSTTAEEVADDMFDGLGKGRAIIHSPSVLGPIGVVLRNLPAPLWRRISSR